MNPKRTHTKLSIKPVIAIVQARMGSTRLPGKALLELGGKPLIYHVFSRAQAIKGIDGVVLATPAGEGNSPIIDLAGSMSIGVFRGSEHNVLERFYLASQEFGASWIIRITGDNPFTDPHYASLILDIAKKENADLASYTGLPLGTAVEVIKMEALDKAYHSASEQYHFEHVTPYIKEHGESFRILRIPAGLDNTIQGFRLTVDTDEDYSMAKRIYDDLYKGDIISLEQLFGYLKKNPHVAEINRGVQQRAMTESNE